MPTIAYLPCSLSESRLGLPSRLTADLRGRPVLHWTLDRLRQCRHLDAIVLAHEPADGDALAALTHELPGDEDAVPVKRFALPDGMTLDDERRAQRIAARKWSLSNWRGGIGNMTVYDELLPAAPIDAAMAAHHADAVLLVGPDWVLVDPDACDRCIAAHTDAPDAMKLTFTQAPPGLAGLVTSRDIIGQFAQVDATFGHTLMYQPKRPQPDPVNRDVCLDIPASIRSLPRRFIADTDRGCNMLRALIGALGDRAPHAGLALIAEALTDLEHQRLEGGLWHELPQQTVLPLTPFRMANGPITVPPRPDATPLELDVVLNTINRIAPCGDACLTLGGNGDALLYDDLDRVIEAAQDAGVFGIYIETDLLCDIAVIDQLLDWPIDAIGVRLNADSPETYQKVMGVDAYKPVTRNLKHALNTINGHEGHRSPNAPMGKPWIVPRMAKTDATIEEMESFFDRWLTFAGHAVIEACPPGCPLDNGSMLRLSAPKRAMNPEYVKRSVLQQEGILQRTETDPAYALS